MVKGVTSAEHVTVNLLQLRDCCGQPLLVVIGLWHGVICKVDDSDGPQQFEVVFVLLGVFQVIPIDPELAESFSSISGQMVKAFEHFDLIHG